MFDLLDLIQKLLSQIIIGVRITKSVRTNGGITVYQIRAIRQVFLQFYEVILQLQDLGYFIFSHKQGYQISILTYLGGISDCTKF